MNKKILDMREKSNKQSLSEKKENTINSLFEVENFLTNLKKALKCINIYKLLK